MDPAERTPPRPITDRIKQLFRSAAKAITGSSEDEPPPERRRKKEGESESGMMQLIRQFSRLFTAKRAPQAMHVEDVRGSFCTERAAITRPDTLPLDFFGATGAGWSDTLALFSQWNDEALAADHFDDSFDINNTHSSLNL